MLVFCVCVGEYLFGYVVFVCYVMVVVFLVCVGEGFEYGFECGVYGVVVDEVCVVDVGVVGCVEYVVFGYEVY